MKISELIEALYAMQQDHGDVKVTLSQGHWDVPIFIEHRVSVGGYEDVVVIGQ